MCVTCGVNMYIFVCKYIYVPYFYVHTYIILCIVYMSIYLCANTYIYGGIYLCANTYIYTHVWCVHVCTYTYNWRWLGEQLSQQIFPRNDAYPIPHTNTRTHITQTHVHVRTRSLAHPPIHTHPLTRTHVCTHTHTNSIEYSFIFMYQKMPKALLPKKQP